MLTGESQLDVDETPELLLGQLGEYHFGPRTKDEIVFEERYKDAN